MTGERYELPDPGLPGLALRISSKGQKTWTVVYRVRGSGEVAGERVARLAGAKRRLTLGEYPAVGLAEARAKAAEVKRLARSGVDTSAAGTQDDSQSSAPIVADLIDRYVADHLRRNEFRAGSNAEKQLRLHVGGAWNTRPVVSITRTDLVLLLEKVRIQFEVQLRHGDRVERRKRGGPGAAAEVRKWTRAMFQFAVEVGLRPDNPFSDVKNRDKQRSRDRVLSMAELVAVWEAAGPMNYPWGPYYRLILLTGDRRGEWAEAQWDWLDGERGRLEIPAAQYKTGKAQVVPLSSQARAIIQGLPRGEAGPFLFSSDGGATPVSGFSKAKARLDRHLAKAGNDDMAPWVVHDLRRSMATHMERIGVEPHVIEVCLGHVLKGVAGTYRHYGYLPEKTAALQAWADELLASVPVVGSPAP
ncbi:MAG: tyrosine-type recombinase/integrase [Acetobacteraceae bacterium]